MVFSTRFGRLVLALALLSGPARAHDIYTGERRPGLGTSCCGGDPVTGECEALSEDQIAIEPDGGMTIVSRRYAAMVRVSRDQIQFKPIAGAPREAMGHWCGTARASAGHVGEQPDQLQPDPRWWTFCAFLTPGDV